MHSESKTMDLFAVCAYTEQRLHVKMIVDVIGTKMALGISSQVGNDTNLLMTLYFITNPLKV